MSDKNEMHTCCFFGHRKIDETEELKKFLHGVIEDLIVNKKVDIFLFGSKSEFDELCYRVVTSLKQKYINIRRIYVRAAYPDINDSYKNYLLKSYEETYYPQKLIGAGKASYVERNCEMINSSKFCVIYYDKNYAPPRRKNSRKDLTDYQPKSGTKIAYDYAVKKKKEIINIFELYANTNMPDFTKYLVSL